MALQLTCTHTRCAESWQHTDVSSCQLEATVSTSAQVGMRLEIIG